VAPGNHWIAFKLVGTRSNRSAIGAEVTLETGATRQLQIVDGGMGFASQNDRRLHFGLGRTGRADRVVIRWPSAPYRPSSSSPWTACMSSPSWPLAAACGSGWGDGPALPGLVPHHAHLVLGEARYGILAVRAARHRARRLRGQRARAVTPAARLVRERAECLHHRYQPRAADQAPADLLWPFALGGFIAIASKYVLRYRDRHLWNPSNFAISLLLLAAPASVAILSRQWGNDLATNAVIWGFGLLIVSRSTCSM